MMNKLGNYIKSYIKGKVPTKLINSFIKGSEPYLTPEYLRGNAKPDFYTKDLKKTVLVENEDIIILWDGSNAGEIFSARKGILASTMVKLNVDNTKIDQEYFKYSCLNNEYILRAKTAGSGIPHVDKKIVKDLPIYVPQNKKEQKLIAMILSTIDQAIESVENTIKSAEKLKKSLMQNLLTGKLKTDGTWRKEEEFSHDIKYGKYPKYWSFSHFIDFAVLQRGKDLTDNDVINGDYPVVKSNGIQIYHNSFFVKPPGVVTGRSGTIGKAFYLKEPFWAHNTTLYIKDFKGNNPKFIYYLILIMDFRKYYAGTTVPTLNRNDIHRLKVAIPKSPNEQAKIVDILDSLEEILINKEDKKNSLKKLKKSLMQNLLTGKKRIDIEKIDQLLKEE